MICLRISIMRVDNKCKVNLMGQNYQSKISVNINPTMAKISPANPKNQTKIFQKLYQLNNMHHKSFRYQKNQDAVIASDILLEQLSNTCQNIVIHSSSQRN